MLRSNIDMVAPITSVTLLPDPHLDNRQQLKTRLTFIYETLTMIHPTSVSLGTLQHLASILRSIAISIPQQRGDILRNRAQVQHTMMVANSALAEAIQLAQQGNRGAGFLHYMQTCHESLICTLDQW